MSAAPRAPQSPQTDRQTDREKLGALHIPSAHPSCPGTKGTGLSSWCLPQLGTRMCLVVSPGVPRAGALAPRDAPGSTLGQQGRGQRRMERRKRRVREQAGPELSSGPQPWSSTARVQKAISLLKAGYLATLMKSALVSGSALSSLLYFCLGASFSYYKQDFQS